MAHLNQKKISDNSCKAIIIDTILEAVRPLTRAELSKEIASVFHVLVTPDRLNQIINELSSDKVLYFDAENRIKLNAINEVEFLTAKSQERLLRQEATTLWISYVRSSAEISSRLETALSQALPIFLRSLFVSHGVSSYELLTTTGEDTCFDLKQIAATTSKQFEESLQADIEDLLPSVFQVLNEPKVVEYLTHSIEKAVGYISEVISDENLKEIKRALKELTLYLDTNTIYRFLNLQGQSRFDSIRETLEFCKANGIKIKVSAQTQKELSARLKYDSKVLIQYPTTTDLAQVGYNYRTSDNYVSTYWNQVATTHLSVEDFVAYYKNYDILLEADDISLEKIEVEEESLIEQVHNFYEKMSLRDPYHEKSTNSLWHDAYNLAYIQKMQKPDAKTAIDTGCLFLTTDQSLLSLQREDHELKENPALAITPSQLLQLFGFSTPDLGYEETFIKFFASSSLGRTFKYENSDIQEILSRINHYQGVNPEIAEKILGRTLIASRYHEATSDEEKEDIIYNTVSEELIAELGVTKEKVRELTTENVQLTDTRQATIDLARENENRFKKEKMELEEKISKANDSLKVEVVARQQAEDEARIATAYSEGQEKLYVDEKMKKWRKRHLAAFWGAIVAIILVTFISVGLCYLKKNIGYLGILGALPIPIATLPYGTTAFDEEKVAKKREQYIANYRVKVESIRQ